GGRGGRARAGDRATPAARARGWTGTAPPGNGGRLSVAPGPRRWVGLAAVRAPALPAQRFLGGGFGRGANPPSEDLAARRVPLGPERLGDLAEDGGVVDRRRRRVRLAVRDPFHRAAQDLARARLGQSLDDERGLERGDGADRSEERRVGKEWGSGGGR